MAIVPKVLAAIGAAAVAGIAAAVTGATYAYFAHADRDGAPLVTTSEGRSALSRPVIRLSGATPVGLTDPWGDMWYRVRIVNAGPSRAEIDAIGIAGPVVDGPLPAESPLEVRALLKPASWRPGSWDSPAWEPLTPGPLENVPGPRALGPGETAHLYFQLRPAGDGAPEPAADTTASLRFRVSLED
ncbi:hypothetical protein ACQEU5_07775 [Marinactinospora thermotolerans]|uniref:Camelysin metallo-endopeptidase n=1 Tax=Marinactinospora thermotolerans DSM 45154 TaxID=1122192 RepID=A0A1T4R786_9ACTN|nr:hypothetical protein [Marinactinospora thermotolerans]SKA11538.1 hypothetical protein SAMN02745673_02560 [Marinactinospora thermotolerans DSM 45154]